MRHYRLLACVFCASGLLLLPGRCRADHFFTATAQGFGTSWTNAIWTNLTVTTPVPPGSGNAYECVGNGNPIANNALATHVRSPVTNATTLVTFLGDSLTLDTNTVLWCKRIAGPVSLAPILNFPGVAGNPGLIINGGLLYTGDANTIFTITGAVRVVGAAYLSPNGGSNPGSTTAAGRSFNIAGQLSGSGTIILFQGVTNTAQEISGNGNTFSGQLIVKAGWLLGSGSNSLGIGNITLDPQFNLGLDPSILDVPGPAVLELNYDANSAGVLTLTNGGMMRLHQNCVFSGVNIETSSLSQGTHSFAELTANFPANFPSGGSGSITVQPPGPVPPAINTQPTSQAVVSGATANFVVAASGTQPLFYQWRAGATNSGVYTNLTDAGQIAGSATMSLVISNVNSNDLADLLVVVTNSVGSATSSVASLNVVPLPPPSTNAIESALMRLDVYTTPFSFQVVEKATGTVLLLQSANQFTFGGTAYTVSAASNVVINANVLGADLVFSGTSSGAHVRFSFAQPDILQVALTSSSASQILQQFADQGENVYGVFEYPTGGKLGMRGTSKAFLGGSGSGTTPNTVNASGAHAPFYMTSRHYAVYAETDAQGLFSVAVNNNTSFSFNVPQVTLNIIYGPAYADMLSKFNALAGGAFVPPLWALDSMWWKDDDHNNFHAGVTNAQSNVLDTADKLRLYQIPAGWINVDRPYGTGNMGWGNLDFDSSFPNPAQMISDLAARGMNLTVWTANRCWSNNFAFTNGLALGYLFTDSNSLSHGPAADLRMTNAYNWWKTNLAFTTNLGIKGYKIDRGEEGEQPDSVQNHAVTLFQKLSSEVLNGFFTNDNFIYSRCACDTGRRYSAVWNGDSYCTFTGLQYSVMCGLRSGLINFPMWGSDTGGYINQPTSPSEELFARWLEFSAFCPMMETVIGNSRTPWYDYTTNLIAITRAQAATHHDLIPYTRSCLYQATQSGMPVMRALFLAYPDDAGLANTADEYLYGPQLLVAPVITAGATNRNLYLPAGFWFDYNSKSALYAGASGISPAAPLSSIPLFVKAGAIIPRGDILKANNNWTPNWSPYLRIEIFPSGGFDSFDYFTGSAAKTITCSNQNQAVVIQFDDLGLSGNLEIYLRNPGTLVRNGTALAAGTDYTYDANQNLLRVAFSGATTLVVSNATTLFAPIEAWRTTWFGTLSNPAVSGNSADPDGDGIPNILEYAFGLNPLVSSTNAAPTASIVSATGTNYLAITFRRATAATDCTFTVMVSPDLSQWLPGSTYAGTKVIPNNANTTEVSRNTTNAIETITVRDNVPMKSAGQRFIRLRVTNP